MTEWGAHLPGLAVAWSGVALGLVSPGPNQLAVMGTAMARGRREGLVLASGIAAGTALWATICVTGLAALVSASGPAMGTLRVGAAAYLAFLAWRAFQAARAPEPPTPTVARAAGPAGLALRGLGVQATNLKAGVYWTALAALGIGAEAPLAVALALVGGCAAISGAGHVAYALAFSHPGTVTAYDRVRPAVQSGLCAFFCIASITILTARP